MGRGSRVKYTFTRGLEQLGGDSKLCERIMKGLEAAGDDKHYDKRIQCARRRSETKI